MRTAADWNAAELLNLIALVYFIASGSPLAWFLTVIRDGALLADGAKSIPRKAFLNFAMSATDGSHAVHRFLVWGKPFRQERPHNASQRYTVNTEFCVQNVKPTIDQILANLKNEVAFGRAYLGISRNWPFITQQASEAE